MFVGCCCWGEYGWVVQVAKDTSCWTTAWIMAGGEEVMRNLDIGVSLGFALGVGVIEDYLEA